MLRSSDQCHEILIALQAQAWQEGAGWLAHSVVPVIMNNSSSNVNEHPSCGGKSGWQFTRDSTTFLWLSWNLNPSPLTTLFQTDQDMTDEFQLPKFLSDSTTPVRTSMSIKRTGFFKFRPLPINNLLVKVNHDCCSMIQHRASSQNQKPRCSSSTYPKPSFWLWQMKWSVAQNRVCMAKFEKLYWLTSYGLGTMMTSSWFAALVLRSNTESVEKPADCGSLTQWESKRSTLDNAHNCGTQGFQY